MFNSYACHYQREDLRESGVTVGLHRDFSGRIERQSQLKLLEVEVLPATALTAKAMGFQCHI